MCEQKSDVFMSRNLLRGRVPKYVGMVPVRKFPSMYKCASKLVKYCITIHGGWDKVMYLLDLFSQWEWISCTYLIHEALKMNHAFFLLVYLTIVLYDLKYSSNTA